jgi:biotin operon repressor
MAEGATSSGFHRKNGFRHVLWARALHLPGIRQAILVVLSTHCDSQGEVWASYSCLAQETGVSRRTVVRALQSLQADGFLRHTGRRKGRANVWHVTCAVQLPLGLADDASKGDTVTPFRRPTGVTVSNKGCHSVHSNFHGTTSLRSSLRDDLPPEVSGMSEELSLQACRERFLVSESRREQTAALVDASRLLFAAPLPGGRAAGLVGRYGHGQNVVDALMAAAGHGAAGPADYMEKVLQGKRREEGGRGVASGEAVTRFVRQREQMWG